MCGCLAARGAGRSSYSTPTSERMLSCVIVWHWLQCVDMQLLCISCKAAADMLLHRPQKQGQRSKKGAEDELLSASGLQFDNKQLLCPRKLRPGRLKCVSMQLLCIEKPGAARVHFVDQQLLLNARCRAAALRWHAAAGP